jgi:hypothetical protein
MNTRLLISGVPDHVAYEGATNVVDYQIGFGALPNHHCLLHALTIQYPPTPYDDSMVDRFQDPTTGAFSYNLGREFFTTRPLEAVCIANSYSYSFYVTADSHKIIALLSNDRATKSFSIMGTAIAIHPCPSGQKIYTLQKTLRRLLHSLDR